MPRWITWAMQPDIAKQIQYYVDTGCNRDLLVQVVCGDPQLNYTEADVSTEISRLVALGLLVDHDGYIKVTEYAHDTVMKALGLSSWEQCLHVLKARGIWHPDMVQYEVVKKEEAP